MTPEVSRFEKMPKLGTRAVQRPVQQGSSVYCESCDDQIKFIPPAGRKNALHSSVVVICNVYEGDRWDRVESFHLDCYEEAAEPHGTALT